MDDTNLITIGCRHAAGIRLRVSEWFKTPGLDEPQLREIAVYDLAGSGQHHGEPGNGTLPGYTKIPAEHWEKWKALNEASDLYASGTIYEAKGGEGDEDAPKAPQLTAEEEQEQARAAAAQQARDQAQAQADAAARAAEEAKAEADRQAKAAAEQQATAGQGGGDSEAGDDGEEPTPDAQFDAMSEDQLRAYLTEHGVTVDGRWGRKKLLVEAEKLKARG